MSLIRKKFTYSYSYVTFIILAINVLIYVLCSKVIYGLSYNLALSVNSVLRENKWYTLITYMFTHYDFEHIFWNMFGLVMFGVTVEKTIGSKEYLLFYFVTGLFSGLLSLVVYYFSGKEYMMLIGSSGVIYAILFAYAVIFPNSKIFLWGIIPIRAPILVLIYVVIEFISGLGFNSQVAHETHLFGFAVAALYFIIRFGINPIKVWINAFKK